MPLTNSDRADLCAVYPYSAMNAIVAYLGLFLSAFIYVPFGELIMAYLTGLGPQTSVGARAVVKTDRLAGQLFACEFR
jgi:anoctamin-10